MFNNRFNSTKKDPLVEAVQSAMQDGEIRRQAVAYVNEAFGVYNRNAVVREDLAAYDAAIEEAYKCMKEAPDTGESDARKTVTSSKEAKEKVFAKHKERVKKLADKDYDKDGKVESPKDEVWGSRFRAAKMAGKMEEEQIDEISKGLALKAMKKSEKRGEEEYDKDETYDRLSDPTTHFDRAKKLRGHMKRKFGNKTIKTGGADNLSSKSYEQGGGERRRADKLTKGPRAGMISARHRDKLKDNIKYSLGKHKKPNLPEETQIDEISKELAGRYIKQADYKRSDSSFQSGKVYGKELATKRRTKQDVETSRKHNRDAFKREKGIDTAVNKLTGKAKVQAREEVDYSAPDRAAVTRDNKPSTPAQTNAATSGPSAADKAALASKISTMKEALKGNQHRIDANKNKRIDAGDFKLLRARKSMKEASDVPGDEKSWKGVEKPHDYSADEARSIRKEYEGSKGEIKKDSKYPGL